MAYYYTSQPPLFMTPPDDDCPPDVEGVEPGTIVAVDVSLEDYETLYQWQRCEYDEGVVIAVSPQSLPHFYIEEYFSTLLKAYFALRPIGRAYGDDITLRLPAFPKRRREPDVFVLLNDNPAQFVKNSLHGIPDICIEIVSEESVVRDYGQKLMEYEKGGVREYWVIDPLRRDCLFYRMSGGDVYQLQPVGEAGYQTPLLPGLTLHISTLWLGQDMPSLPQILESVKTMLGV